MRESTSKAGKRLVYLDTLEEWIKGAMLEVKHGKMPQDTLYVFPSVDGDIYHMRSVPFDLDIVFLDKDYKVLKVAKMESETGTAKAPSGTKWAVEAESGFFNNAKIGDCFE